MLATVGEHVVVAIDLRLIGHDSGVPLNQRIFTVYTMREGKLAASIAYPSEREALSLRLWPKLALALLLVPRV